MGVDKRLGSEIETARLGSAGSAAGQLDTHLSVLLNGPLRAPELGWRGLWERTEGQERAGKAESRAAEQVSSSEMPPSGRKVSDLLTTV